MEKQNDCIIRKIKEHIIKTGSLPGTEKRKPFFCSKSIEGVKRYAVCSTARIAAKFLELTESSFNSYVFHKTQKPNSIYYQFDPAFYLDKAIDLCSVSELKTIIKLSFEERN